MEPHYLGEAAPAVPRWPIYVLLDNVRSAFNVGSFFRTADAAGVAELHLCGLTAFPPNPKLDKTALGAQDYVPWRHHQSTSRGVRHMKERGVLIVAVELHPRAVPLHDFAWPSPVALVFGNEVGGIPGTLLDSCDHIVKIPMHGHKNSLNVATAFGIVVYDVLRSLPAG